MNRYFKTIFVNSVPFILSLLGAYLVGSFVCVSFDPTLWEFNDRLTTAVVGLLWGFALHIKLTWEGLV